MIGNKVFHTKLEEVLETQGRKRVWLARELNVTNATVTNWVRGYTIPNDSMKVRISELLGVSVADLFYDSKYMKVR